MKKILFIAACFILSSCSSDDEFVKSAIIIDSGDPALDGCGWLVMIDSKQYKPINLPEEFEVDDLAVIVMYTVLKEKGDCDVPNSIQQIDIKKIGKKN